MNLEAMLEPADSSENVTKIQPPYSLDRQMTKGTIHKTDPIWYL